MAKLTLDDIVSGYKAKETINTNNAATEAAMENTLSLDGTGPNSMNANLDMNSYRILNLVDAVANQEPVTLSQAATIAGVTNPLTQDTVAAVLWPRTAAETSAGVTPTAYQYESGDVRRYGAVGDNSTDDTTALINAGKSSLNVYIDPSLTCRVTTSLETGIQSGQKWYGGGTITTAASFDHHVFNISAKTDVTVEGIIGTAGALGVAYGSAAARFFRCVSASHRGKLIRCKVTGFQSAAQLNASEHCQVIGNDIITPEGWGINVQTGSHDAIVAWNRVNGVVNEHGIYVSGTVAGDTLRPHIHDNIVTGCAIDGIKASLVDEAHIHDNSSYSNVGQGIYATIAVNRANIHDNNCHSNNENGVLVFDGTASSTTDRNWVHHNRCRNNDKNGVQVTSSGTGAVSRTIVEHNDCQDNNQDAGSFYGISIAGGATTTKTKVISNRVTDETTGINVAASVADTVITDNEFENNTTNITDSGTGTIIKQKTSGATATIADGGTITHGHVKTPTSARVTASVSSEFISVTAIAATTITVAIKKDDGTAGTTQTVYWEVSG